jgi:hypothetical protein
VSNTTKRILTLLTDKRLESGKLEATNGFLAALMGGSGSDFVIELKDRYET